jgi:hypothetical protein
MIYTGSVWVNIDLCACRFRKRISENDFTVPVHKNTGNQYSSTMDVEKMKRWFQAHATTFGEVVPVRFRKQEQRNGVIVHYHTVQNHILLPAYYTWSLLHEGYVTWAEEKE